MQIDLSTVGIIVGCLGFYIQLLLAQRRKTKEWEVQKQKYGNRKKGKQVLPDKPPVFGTFSKSHRDWLFGAVGYLMIMFGILVYVNWINLTGLKTIWWVPVTAGIYLFSWFFR